MRRLWITLLVMPLVLVIPTAASATSSVHAASSVSSVRAASSVRAVHGSPAVAAGTLRLGMKGAAIKQLQRRLSALKYYAGPADGNYSTDTEEAVWAFQEVQGLPGEEYVTCALQK